MTSDPTNPLQHTGVLGRREHAVARHCRATEEQRLVERGWGRWLVRQGYARTDDELRRLNGSDHNQFVDTLAQRPVLMGEVPLGHAEDGGGCPRRSSWSASLDAARVWDYSLQRINTTDPDGPHSITNIGAQLVSYSDVRAAMRTIETFVGQRAVMMCLVPLLYALPLLALLALFGVLLCVGVYLYRAEQTKKERAREGVHKKSDGKSAV